QALESNPMLELDEGDDGAETQPEDTAPDDLLAALDAAAAGPDEATAGAADDTDSGPMAPDTTEAMPDELALDSGSDDVFDTALPGNAPAAGEADGNDPVGGTGETLVEHLAWPLNRTPLPEADRAIATAILEALDN